MKPLVFLTTRSLVNGVRRALTSGRRLIGLIFVIGYYFLMVFRPLAVSRSGGDFPSDFRMDFPPIAVLQAVVFGGFAALTILLAASTSVQRLSFRPADVDVLFATPLSPRLILIFRLIRDYLFTLLIPLLFLIIGWRPSAGGLNVLFKSLPDPNAAPYVGKAFTLAWLLMALCWVAIGYAVSLFINRSDLVSDRNRRVITGGGTALVLLVGAYIAWRVSGNNTAAGLMALANDPLLRVIFFTATAASTMVMAPLQGHWGPFFLAVGGLLGLTIIAIAIAMTQVSWLYDQAAARGFDSLKLRRMQQQGDLVAVAEERARSGKVKARSWGWMLRVKARGARAILWREVLIQIRANPMLVILFSGIAILFGVMPLYATEPGPGGRGGDGYTFLLMQAAGVFMACMITGQSGFIEVLRRVDLEKPLPFTPGVISFAEIVAKAMPATLSVSLASIVCFVLRPSLWPYCLASVIGLPFVAVLFCSVVFLVTILFPDVDDATQRGFRGLMIMLGLSIALLPVLLFAGGVMFLLSKSIVAPLAGAGVGAGAALGISALISMIAGGLYANFNPSE